MRVASKFAQRVDEAQYVEPRGTYFLLFEGTKTEPIYFGAFIEKIVSRIDNILVRVKLIEREKGEQGLSNPKGIVDYVLQHREKWLENGKMHLIGSQEVCYNEKLDKICFIFDRDRISFSESQYEYVMRKCAEQDFHICISNPNFEFWLLLHFATVFSLDRKELLENRKENGKTYTERELEKLIKYTKNRYDAYSLMDKIDEAITNEQHFAEDIVRLCCCVGSNVGLLIQEIMNCAK